MQALRKAAAATLLAACTVFAYSTLPAAAIETHGSGAAYTDRTNQSFTARNGLTSSYHIYAAGVPQDHAAGLVLQFHGDGAYEFKNPGSTYSLGGSSGIIAQARSRGYITVPVLAPDRTGEVTWWENGSANADFVADLVNSLKSSYNIDTEDIWLVGYSGGAQFITQFYLPKYSSQIDGGGSVVFGGGGSPRVSASPFAAGMVSDFPMHWYTGASDSVGFDAIGAARAGVSWYAGRGFETDLESPAGLGHNLSGRFGSVLAKHLDAHQPNGNGGPTPPNPTPSTTPPAPKPSTTPPAPKPSTTPPAPPSGSGWTHTVRPNRTGVSLDVTIPQNVRRTTFRVTTTNSREYWYTYTTATGQRTLNLTGDLKPGTEYRYTIEADSRAVASGTFRTTGDAQQNRRPARSWR